MSSYRKKHGQTRASKRSREAQPDTGYQNPGIDREIHTDRLTSGLPYQRPVNPKEVDRLIREWDERLLDPITVSFRDGKFYVVDGQHRISAMRRMNGGNGVMVNCKVYSGLTYEQEAALCYRLDKAKKRLSLSQSTNALADRKEQRTDGGDRDDQGSGECLQAAGRSRIYPYASASVGRMGGGSTFPYCIHPVGHGSVREDL